MNLPAIPDQPLPATTAYAYTYPLGPAPTALAGDTLRQAGDDLYRIAALVDGVNQLRPYPCALCKTDMARWPQTERVRHWRRHPLLARVNEVGWLKAVTG